MGGSSKPSSEIVYGWMYSHMITLTGWTFIYLIPKWDKNRASTDVSKLNSKARWWLRRGVLRSRRASTFISLGRSRRWRRTLRSNTFDCQRTAILIANSQTNWTPCSGEFFVEDRAVPSLASRASTARFCVFLFFLVLACLERWRRFLSLSDTHTHVHLLADGVTYHEEPRFLMVTTHGP